MIARRCECRGHCGVPHPGGRCCSHPGNIYPQAKAAYPQPCEAHGETLSLCGYCREGIASGRPSVAELLPEVGSQLGLPLGRAA